MFKHTALLFLLSASALLVNAAIAAQDGDLLSDCMAKHKTLNQQAEEARKLGSTSRLETLHDEMAQSEAECQKAGQHAHGGIAMFDAELSVHKQQDKLRFALSKGDASNIAEHQNQLTAAREDLKQVKAQLNP